MIEPYPKPGRKLKNAGRNEWLAFRRQWIKNHPPDYRGYYMCGICGNFVHKTVFELDHVLKRGSNPHLVFEESNLRPCHKVCNNAR